MLLSTFLLLFGDFNVYNAFIFTWTFYIYAQPQRWTGNWCWKLE